jgi:hypothetical protein
MQSYPGLTDQLQGMNTTMFPQSESPTYNMTSPSGDASLTGATGKQPMKMPSSGGGSQSTYQPYQATHFMANNWQDIGGGELQSTGQAGASMNLYLQKMLSNPAIMQLLQQRMSQSGVSNG